MGSSLTEKLCPTNVLTMSSMKKVSVHKIHAHVGCIFEYIAVLFHLLPQGVQPDS